jgi:hypothetical protein
LKEILRPFPTCAGPARCADAARTRGEPVAASAVPYSRYLLLEVPGPWGGVALDERHLNARLADSLTRATADGSMNVLLIRRTVHPAGRRAGRTTGSNTGHNTGRQRPAPGDEPRAWALADTTPGAERILWGSWRQPDDLADIDLTASLPADSAASGPQRVALTCTNGKRDQCCAILGRPVAEALSMVPGWDAWECTHLGGHRFAATVMLLPTGDMFGQLDQRSARTAVERFDAGQLLLSHYRGRSGQSLPVQAALHAAATRLGDSRRQAFHVVLARQLPAGADRWEVRLSHLAGPGQEDVYLVVVAGAALPALLSCTDELPKAEAHYTAVSFTRVER